MLNKTLQNYDTVESEQDENGYFTRTEIIKKENGEMVKRISKVRRYKEIKHIYPTVIERRKNWKPFGLAASSNNNITFVSNENILMEPPSPTLKSQKNNPPEIICLKCNLHHFNLDCPKIESVKHDYKKNFNNNKKNNDFRKDKESD